MKRLLLTMLAAYLANGAVAHGATITAFSIPSTSNTFFVPILTFTVSDNTDVGYCLTETSSSSDCEWSSTVPTNYIFSVAGKKTLHAWAKDAAGAVSNNRSASVTITVSGTPAASSGAPSILLPKTGQTTSYGDRDDGALQMGVAMPAVRFTDNVNGTVTDNLTGLVWLKNANCFGRSSWEWGWHTWDVALFFVSGLGSGQCGLTDGSVAGDWRLPNRAELESLLDLSRFGTAMPVAHPFVAVQSIYWSSSTCNFISGDSTYAWAVDMSRGDVFGLYKDADNGFFTWPVRSGH